MDEKSPAPLPEDQLVLGNPGSPPSPVREAPCRLPSGSQPTSRMADTTRSERKQSPWGKVTRLSTRPSQVTQRIALWQVTRLF